MLLLLSLSQAVRGIFVYAVIADSVHDLGDAMAIGLSALLETISIVKKIGSIPKVTTF